MWSLMPASTPFNDHVLQANALLHGHAWIGETIHEQVVVGGHHYILHPPLAALVCVPFVAIWGTATNQTAICWLLGMVATALAWRLVHNWWLVATFASMIAYETWFGHSWGFCLVLSTVPTMLALMSRKAWVIGLWAGLAALARYDLMLVWPIYGAMLWLRD